MMQTGISQEEMDKKTVIGPGNIFKSVNPDAKMFFVEHSGKSIQAGENELKKLEQWAEILGLSPFISASGVATATEVTMRESRINTSVQSWIRNMESTLENAYRGAAQWVSIRLPKDFKTDIYSEFAVSVRDPEDIRSLDLARARLDITGETFIKEQKRRGILSEDIDPGKEASAALEEKKEGLALSAQNGTPEKGRPPQTVRSNQLETKPNTQPTLQFQRK